jgi:WD40 repeat protein
MDQRFIGHMISSYRIQCHISPDGKLFTSGSTNGTIHIYDWKTCQRIQCLRTHSNSPCLNVQWHPTLQDTLASSTWDGHIYLWEASTQL